MRMLAKTKDGRITWCTASEENVGKGRCNHVDHQRIDETANDFIKRHNIIKRPYQEKRINHTIANYESYDYLKLNFPSQTETAYVSFKQYSNYVNFIERKISLMTINELGSISSKEDREEYASTIRRMEEQRVQYHNVVLDNCRKLNNLCNKLRIDNFMNEVSIEANRDSVAEAIFEFCEIIDDLEIVYKP